jgi:hypothetical protein
MLEAMGYKRHFVLTQMTRERHFGSCELLLSTDWSLFTIDRVLVSDGSPPVRLGIEVDGKGNRIGSGPWNLDRSRVFC